MKKTYSNIGFFILIKIFINKNKMRRFDKKLNIERANLLAEQRYLKSKDLINENIDENRFLNPNRQYEELLNNQDINKFVNNFEQYRDKALANVDFEINPAFSDVIVRFVNKTNPSTSGGFYDPLISGDRDNYESGQIMFKYNDTTCIFKGELQGDSIDYSYYKTIQTNYNKPRTSEALQVAKTFEDMCKLFRFRLNKNEVPTMYYKK